MLMVLSLNKIKELPSKYDPINFQCLLFLDLQNFILKKINGRTEL